MLTGSVGLVSYALAAVAFLVLAGLLLVNWRRGAIGAFLSAACMLTALWAAVAAAASAEGGGWADAVRIAEILRFAGWLAFLQFALFRTRLPEESGYGPLKLFVPVACALIATAAFAYDVAQVFVDDAELPVMGIDLDIVSRLALSVIALLLVENLFRNIREDRVWAVKFLCFGLGGVFIYDFYLYSDALLFHRVNADLQVARGVINALIVPLIAVTAARYRKWDIDVAVSRRAVFHSATLLGTGVYLLVMAGVGYYLRQVGGEWGPMLNAVFLFAAILLIVIVLFSGSYRAWLRVNISKHFFSYRYDYREEWLRLIATMSSVGGTLPARAIQAVADIVESPAGWLWMRTERDDFTLMGTWNIPFQPETQRASDGFVRFLEEKHWVVNLEKLRTQTESYEGLSAPDWLADTPRTWLVVPLIHAERLRGILVIARPRVPRDVNWEDYDLLKTVGRQVASYLAEEAAAQSLVESRQFDEFNRRFAFVLHDIKNLVSQLSLMLSNADKHRHNPAFQEDMLQTVKESVEKLNRLLVRLHQSGREAASSEPVELGSVIRRIIAENSRPDRAIDFVGDAEPMTVMADEQRFSAVIAHLIGNAQDAIREGGRIEVRLRARGSEAVIEIVDDGQGMDPEFVRDRLFKPFQTTKPGGYGIGAYESRAYVQELGGRLDVISERGRGTTVRISLAMVNRAAPTLPQVASAI